MNVKRTRVQFDEATYDALKKKAFERRVSMSTVVREAVPGHLGTAGQASWDVRGLTFIGSGSSETGRSRPLSVHHDEALADTTSTAADEGSI